MSRRLAYAVAVAAALSTITATTMVRAGGDKVVFPEKFADGKLYAVVERADIKQYRELYTTAAAIEAAKAGQPMPDGTVITMVTYQALPDINGNPQKGRDGHFIRGVRLGHFVMEKRAGWGAEYAGDKRNGEWEYQAFTAARAVNDKANLGACFTCHKPQDKQDFVFSYGRMKAAN